MTKSTFVPLRILLIACVIPRPPAFAAPDDPDPWVKRYPVVVTPGTPSVWSMEQAHYLLNRLRANNDSIQTKALTPDDLDPNAVSGLRLEAVQTTFNASAQLNSVAGLQNQVALQQFGQNSTRHDELVRQADVLRGKLYQDQLAVAELKGQLDQLKSIQAAAAAQNPTVTSATDPMTLQIASLTGRITALDAQNTATSNQITTLTTLAGATPTLGDLKTVDAPGTLTPPQRMLDDSVKKLFSKTVDSFTPKVQASVALDSSLQMQYEIVAKQLTSLRDEVGPGHRILFLEMPTTINSSDRRVWTGNGGEDKLAQSWWKIQTIYRRYNTEDSPCWAGSGPDDQLHFSESDVGVHEPSAAQRSGTAKVAAHPKAKAVAANINAQQPTPARKTELIYSAEELSRAAYALGISAKDVASVIGDIERVPANNDSFESDKEKLAGIRNRLQDVVSNLHRTGIPVELTKAAADLEDSYVKLANVISEINEDVVVEEVSKKQRAIARELRTERTNFRAAWDEFMNRISPATPHSYESKDELLFHAESGCRTKRVEYQLIINRLDNLHDSVQSWLDEATKAKNSAPEAEVKEKKIARIEKIQELLKEIQKMEGRRLGDLLPIHQAEIYQKLGGPKQIAHAFRSAVHQNGSRDGSGVGTGDVRAVDLIPRQTALNVNTTHASVRDIGLSWAWHTLFGFGLKVDYQQQRETYNQFMQQEAFASGFGKGKAEFGWTFGPLPGSRVINSGTRNTYAVLVVPDDTSALDLEGTGCAFHRTHDPFHEYPGGEREDQRELKSFNCGSRVPIRIEVPDRTNDGGFFVSGIDYKPTDAGKKTSILLRGRYFSPQTTVLVNGRRLAAVLGVGKPAQNLESGPVDSPDDSAITGVFENVNRSQLVLDISIPAKYDGPDFPVITLIAPSRAIIVNHLSLLINGSYGKLDNESLIPKKDPRLALSAWRYLGLSPGGKFKAHLTGQKFSTMVKDRIYVNGVTCDPADVMSDTAATVICPISELPEWEFIAVSNEKKPTVSTLLATDPRLITLTSYSTLDGVKYGDDLHASLVSFRLIGTGFTPRTVLAQELQDQNRFVVSYVSSTELLCTIKHPEEDETITVREPARGPALEPARGPASIHVARPPDKAKADAPAKETTVTTVATEKKVVKK